MKTNFVVMCANDEEARHVMRLLKTYSFSRVVFQEGTLIGFYTLSLLCINEIRNLVGPENIIVTANE